MCATWTGPHTQPAPDEPAQDTGHPTSRGRTYITEISVPRFDDGIQRLHAAMKQEPSQAHIPIPYVLTAKAEALFAAAEADASEPGPPQPEPEAAL